MHKIIAIPTENGNISTHFGRCEKFTIYKTLAGRILSQTQLEPPVHEPGAYPKYLNEHGVNTVICCGMGPKAKQLFDENNIEVYVGVETSSLIDLVEQYLDGVLTTGDNQCDQ